MLLHTSFRYESKYSRARRGPQAIFRYFWFIRNTAHHSALTTNGNTLLNAKSAARALESLGNETRLTIYRALVRAGPAGLPVGKLKDRVGIPGSTLSHHIATLVASDLVSQDREGRVLRCRANYPRMRALVRGLHLRWCHPRVDLSR